MSKERLEEIKERYMEHEYDYGLSAIDIDWLIEQSERVQELEETNKKNYWIASDFKFKNLVLEQQNKRYREALEEIARGRFPGASYKARKALEGTE